MPIILLTEQRRDKTLWRLPKANSGKRKKKKKKKRRRRRRVRYLGADRVGKM